jgi:asparagine synthase (glutamine-hydrolysing)
MPGIVGLITKMPRAQAEQQLHRMVGTLCHEPSYVSGTWIDEAMGVYVGWVARKNSFSEGMPLRNEGGDVTLFFSGEDYPEPGTASRLKERGHELATDGPSYLVHLAEEDRQFPVGLNGRFHGLLIERTRGMATLFNDRYGLHRIYYHESNDGFYFAPEAKAVLAVRPELRTADPRGLGEFVACGCVLENRTLFKGLYVLPPASSWRFRQGSLREKGTYFQPQEWENQEPLEPEAYYQELRESFSRILPGYFNGPEKIGMSLTGGLDTRMIMAWHQASPGSLPCYSFGGMFRDCEDVTLARRVAKECGQTFEVITVGEEFLSRFSHYAERAVYLADGCVNVSRSSDLYANEKASLIAPVRMTGNYGSEVLRHLRAFKPVEPAAGLFRQEFLSQVHVARGTYAAMAEGHALSFIAFRQTPWHHYGLLGLEQTQLSVRSPYLDNKVVRTAFRAPDAATPKSDIFANDGGCVRLIRDGNPGLAKTRTDRGFAGPSGGMSAALKRDLLEFTFKAEYAYDYGMPQWVAGIDHRFSWFHLERLFLGRHKFNHYRVWYRDRLSAYVREMLLDPLTLSRPYLDPNGVEAVVRGHLAGNKNYTTQIHQLLTLELTHRMFLDGPAPPSLDDRGRN